MPQTPSTPLPLLFSTYALHNPVISIPGPVLPLRLVAVQANGPWSCHQWPTWRLKSEFSGTFYHVALPSSLRPFSEQRNEAKGLQRLVFSGSLGKWHRTKYTVGALSLLFERNVSTLEVVGRCHNGAAGRARVAWIMSSWAWACCGVCVPASPPAGAPGVPLEVRSASGNHRLCGRLLSRGAFPFSDGRKGPHACFHHWTGSHLQPGHLSLCSV